MSFKIIVSNQKSVITRLCNTSLLILFTAISCLAQKSTWTTYFPVESGLIGKGFISKKPNDAIITYTGAKVKIYTPDGSSTLTREQKTSSEFSLNSIFRKLGLRVADVSATKVRIDRIAEESLQEITPNIPFVYAGLRADSVVITFRKSNKVEVNSTPIIDSLKKIYPNVASKEVGKLINFLKMSLNTKDSLDQQIAISGEENKNVYFMLQVGLMEFPRRSHLVRWTNYCASFLNSQGRYSRTINLDSLSAKNRHTDVVYANTSVQPGTQVWLQISNDKKSLQLAYRRNRNSTNPEFINLHSEDGKLDLSDQPVFRIPFDLRNGRQYYKDVILTLKGKIDRKKDGTIKNIIIESGANNRNCGASFINYPESTLQFLSY